MPYHLAEKIIENSILHYLASIDVFAWKVKSVGTYDPTLKRFRKSSALYMKGVADILGIYNGKPLAIEVKSANGRVSVEQRVFLKRFQESGGIAIIARSVAEVEETLKSA